MKGKFAVLQAVVVAARRFWPKQTLFRWKALEVDLGYTDLAREPWDVFQFHVRAVEDVDPDHTPNRGPQTYSAPHLVSVLS